MDGFWQIKKYIGEGKFTGIFSAVQMFVISNGVDTKYFSAAGDTELNPKFISGWLDRENNPVPDYLDFAQSVLRIPQAHEMISRYTVLDEDAKHLILLRPYQIHAIEAIREASKQGKSGFVWHTTGSGKTLTSYKATRNLLMDIPSIDKAIFLIDRKDLDTQTTMAFQAYANNDLVDVDETDNVNDLKKKLKPDDRRVIVTTIQKLHILITKKLKEDTPEYRKIKNLRIAFVVDPKVADIMSNLITEIEMDDTKYRGQSILHIVENMKQDCIDRAISDFCITWYASKADVMYAATHYQNGEIPNESAIKMTADYTSYKSSREKALPKFKYYTKMMAELRKLLDEEIKPLLMVA